MGLCVQSTLRLTTLLVVVLMCHNALAVKPNIPNLNVPTFDSDGRYEVTWESLAGATRYVLVGELSGTLYSGTARSLSRNKPYGTYYYKVKACNGSKCSAYSAKHGILVGQLSSSVPVVPSLNVPTFDSDGRYEVTWESVAGATRYVLVGELSGTLYSGTARSLSRQKPNGHYYYKVKACNGNKCSPYSDKKGIRVGQLTPSVPSVPSLNVATFDSDGRYEVTWGNVSEATRYELVGELSGTLYNGTARSLPRQKPNGNYYYKVKACNGIVCSAYSPIKGIRVGRLKPSVPSLNVPATDSDGLYEVTWISVSLATHYVLVGELSGTLYSGTARSLSRNKPSGTYYYKIKACNGNVCSAYSTKKRVVVAQAVNIKPTINTASPANNSRFSTSDTVTASANARDSDGSIKQVQFKLSKSGGSQGTWQSDNRPPYSKNFGKLSAGNYTLSYRAKDNDNAYSDVVQRRIVVTEQVTMPNINLNSPTNDQLYTTSQAVIAEATGSLTSGINNYLQKVQFKLNDGPWQTISTPFGIGYLIFVKNFGRLAAGEHKISYRAKDNDNAYSDEVQRRIVVIQALSAPTITLAEEDYSGSYEVKWNAVAGATSYKLYNKSNTLLYTGSGNKFSRASMPAGSYSYQVSACNANGCSEKSQRATILVLLDDNSIEGIDDDGNGIRDDIELKITQLAAANSLKFGYLQHTAFYMRAFLESTTKADKTRYFAEIIKGKTCLVTASNDEQAYATLMGSHLDNKARFQRYIQNSNDINEEGLSDNSLTCVLKGTGVQPISGCFQQEYSWQAAVHVKTYKDDLVMGENVKLIIKVINQPQWGGTFDFSYFLGGTLQASKTMANKEEFTWTINNYNFDRDGYLKLLADNPSQSSMFYWSVTCETN